VKRWKAGGRYRVTKKTYLVQQRYIDHTTLWDGQQDQVQDVV
jgi:hypothetical protein